MLGAHFVLGFKQSKISPQPLKIASVAHLGLKKNFAKIEPIMR